MIHKNKPPFLLVHGGMVGGWCWKKVRHCLEGKGHVVWTPTLTGLGERKHLSHPGVDLELHINDIVNMISYEDLSDIILVGHSYGGMVITGVADRVPQKINRLIYLDALIPQNGESMFDIVDPKIISYLTNAAQAEGDGWQVPPPPPQSYNFDDPEDTKWVTSKSTPHPLKSFEQRLSLQNSPKAFPKHYIKCLRDHSLDSMLERAKNMGFTCSLIDSGHFPMITEPEKLCTLLI
jgi:pimeloyl-ACP methyl ester carboxylesterase